MKRDFQIQKQGGKEKGGFFKEIIQGKKEASGNGEGDENSLEESNQESGNGHGDDGFEENALDDTTKTLADQFSVFMNPKNLSKMTPHLCRKGCKHYDSAGDQKSAEFREFCWKSKETRIERDSVCGNFESKYPNLPEGVLTF